MIAAVMRYLAGFWKANADQPLGHPAAAVAVLTAPAPPRPLRPLPAGEGALWLEALYDLQAALLARMNAHGANGLGGEAKLIAEYKPGAPIDAPTMGALRAADLGEQEPPVCDHSFVASRCPFCHKQVCDLPHNGERGWGCDHRAHGLCTGFTPPFDTYRCDCICHCPRQPKSPQEDS
ncbi:hypothetical protein [Microbispora sp. CA-102843]|uniref:hypothetical protein n=1 Tax=Microbispora sp. CA-102843 TaxID=3239952 RepID=UPI003D8F0ECB